MEVQQFQSQLFATLHFVKEGSPAFGQSLFFGMSQVYQVTIVRENVFGGEAEFLTIFFEETDTIFG